MIEKRNGIAETVGVFPRRFENKRLSETWHTTLTISVIQLKESETEIQQESTILNHKDHLVMVIK